MLPPLLDFLKNQGGTSAFFWGNSPRLLNRWGKFSGQLVNTCIMIEFYTSLNHQAFLESPVSI